MTPEPLPQDLLKTLLAEVQSLRTELTKLKAKPEKRLLSFRQAAQRLGIDRNQALHILIKTKQLRTVQANGRTRIPLTEIERLAQEGFDLTRTPPRKKIARPKPNAVHFANTRRVPPVAGVRFRG